MINRQVKMTWEKSSVLSLDFLIEKFKLRKNTIYETIISTYDKENNLPHAAPMGIIITDEDYILIRPYKTSRTYKFMEQYKYAAINFIDDLELFYKFSQEDKDMNKLKDYFEVISEFNSPIFKTSMLSIEIKIIEDLDIEGIRAQFKCKPLHYIYKSEFKKLFEPINRASGCVLESIIHATRISIYRRINTPELLKKVEKLIFLLNHYREIIKKVYPNSKYEKIIDDIFIKLNLD